MEKNKLAWLLTITLPIWIIPYIVFVFVLSLKEEIRDELKW